MAVAAPMTVRAQTVDCGVFEAVEPGDTLETIARRCGIAPSRLADLNARALDDGLAMGSVVTITPFEGTPDAEEIEGPTDDPALAHYRDTVRGLWRGANGRCADIAGTWSFGDVEIRGNATRFEIDRISGTPEVIVADATRTRDGEGLRLDLRPTETGLAVTGPGIATDLLRCD